MHAADAPSLGSASRPVKGAAGPAPSAYDTTRARVADYFDRTATRTWERLTSDAPVSGIRQTVREGRDRMRAVMLSQLPEDLSGQRVLDAGCGAGQMTVELARRGAQVTAVDISPRLIAIAAGRLPAALRDRVTFAAGDMLDPAYGSFDHLVAMDSMIYYTAADIGAALGRICPRVGGRTIFTVAPRTTLLMAMWTAGRLFPRSDRSPMMVPHAPHRLSIAAAEAGARGSLYQVARVARGFYISTCLSYTRGPRG